MTRNTYLHAHPGIRQVIGGRLYYIKWMHSTRDGALKCIEKVKRKWDEVRLYIRMKDNKKFGRHPYCVAVRGRR